jgi:phosphate acetyltransferase
MSRILELRKKARQEKRTVVLPEGDDPRVLKGASFLGCEDLVNVILLGRISEVKALAGENGISLDNVQLVDPFSDPRRENVINAFYEKRKHKGMTPEEAEKTLMDNHVYYGAGMVRLEMADGFVAGASHTTGDVARAGIYCLDIDRGIGTVSSSFLMEMNDDSFGEDGLLAYGDCGIIPYPSARQLTGIAIATSDLFRKLFDVEPRVAMLSYSTHGSASGESIDTVRQSIEKIKGKRPGLMIDGEIQVDAALVPDIARRKCPDSPVAGKANVLIFPNLDAGNISYKLTQRLGKARAVGPIMQGLKKPCSDLSRGCSWEDVVDTAVVTAVRSQGA